MNGKNSKTPLSIIFIGDFAIDNIIRDKKMHGPSIGGSVSYCSLSLKTYTSEVDLSIISNIGKNNFDDALLEDFKKLDIDLSEIKYFNTNNTNFVLDYHDGIRTLTLKSKSPNLEFQDFPKRLFDDPPDAIVLVPLCNEISFNYVSQIVEKFPTTFIGIDLQGFIRKINDKGAVSLIPSDILRTDIEKIIHLIGDRLILKGSEDEMKLLSRKDGLLEVMEYFSNLKTNSLFIMTLGEAGQMIIKNGEETLKVPAFQTKIVVDETGAGDVYLSIFMYEFINSDKSWQSIKKCALLASASASFLIEKAGPSGFKTKDNVKKRVINKKYI